MKFNDFLNIVSLNDINLIDVNKSILDKYKIKVINNVIEEKQIIESNKLVFVCFKNISNLQFHLNSLQLLFNPKYCFTFNNNGYLIMNNDWKLLTKQLDIHNSKSIIKHLIISVLCGLNQISKTIQDKQFTLYNITDFKLNTNSTSKINYEIYNKRINKTLIYKPKYNIKYFGINDKLDDIKKSYETLPFYNFLYSFYQYFKLTKQDNKDNITFKIFKDYLNILTKEDNFKTLNKNNIQNYITEHNYYSTYEELLNLNFVFKTIGYRYIKYLRNKRKNNIMKIKNMKNDIFNYRIKNMYGGQITENIEEMYDDVNNIDQIDKLQNYSDQNNTMLFNNINDQDDVILKEYDDFSNVSNSRYRIIKVEPLNEEDTDKFINFKSNDTECDNVVYKFIDIDNDNLINFNDSIKSNPYYFLNYKSLDDIISYDNSIFNNYLSFEPNYILKNKKIKKYIDQSTINKIINDNIDYILNEFDNDTITIKKNIKNNVENDESLFDNINKWIDNELMQYDSLQYNTNDQSNVKDFIKLLNSNTYDNVPDYKDEYTIDLRTKKTKHKKLDNDDYKLWFGVDDKKDSETMGGNNTSINDYLNSNIKRAVDDMIDDDKINKIVNYSSVENKRYKNTKKIDDLSDDWENNKKYWFNSNEHLDNNSKGGVYNNENKQNYNNPNKYNNNQQFKYKNNNNQNNNLKPNANKPEFKKSDNELITRSYNEQAYKFDIEDKKTTDKLNKIISDIEYGKEITVDDLMTKGFITKGRYYGLYKNQEGETGNEFYPYKKRLNTFYIEDLIPYKFNIAKFNFGDLGQRLELVNYLNDFLLYKTNSKDINANSISSLFKVMKIINTYPEAYKGNDKLLKYESRLLEIRPDYVSFRSCYPLTIENGEVNCAANSTFINVKLYNLTHGEYYLRNKFNLLKTNDNQKDIKIDQDIKEYDNVKDIYDKLTIKDIKQSAAFREANYYNYITKNIIETNICPHFPLLIGYKVVKEDTVEPNYIDDSSVPSYVIGSNDRIDKTNNIKTFINEGYNSYNYQVFEIANANLCQIIITDNVTNEKYSSYVNKDVFTKIASKYGGFKAKYDENDRMIIYYVLKETNKDIFKKNILIKDPNSYTTKTLALITENPGYSFDSWFKPEYVYENKMKKMVDTGYKSLDEWKSIIFQILYTFQIMIDKGINIPNLSIDNLFVQHSNIDINDNYYYSIYKINNISYYIPFYGDTIMFDLLHKDVINTDKVLIPDQLSI